MSEPATFCGIPVRNIWLLLLYASELFHGAEMKRRMQGREAMPDELPEIVAEILIHFVRQRIARGLTRSAVRRSDDLHRVRGNINMLRTESHQLLRRGLVACHFMEASPDTPRNRLILAALERGARLPHAPEISRRCREYAGLLRQTGVHGPLPTRAELSREVFGRNEQGDREAVAAARLLLDMAIPDMQEGILPLLMPEARDGWLRRLYENAVRGFYRVAADDWHTEAGNVGQQWPLTEYSAGMEAILPRMELDIVMTNARLGRKIVIDTKFTSLLKKGWFRDQTLSSGYLYQMYTYLRSQEERGPLEKSATGILLHPALEDEESYWIRMQGHFIIFATVNLAGSASEIRTRLLYLLTLNEELCKA